jgi:hypothetical protein
MLRHLLGLLLNQRQSLLRTDSLQIDGCLSFPSVSTTYTSNCGMIKTAQANGADMSLIQIKLLIHNLRDVIASENGLRLMRRLKHQLILFSLLHLLELLRNVSMTFPKSIGTTIAATTVSHHWGA